MSKKINTFEKGELVSIRKCPNDGTGISATKHTNPLLIKYILSLHGKRVSIKEIEDFLQDAVAPGTGAKWITLRNNDVGLVLSNFFSNHYKFGTKKESPMEESVLILFREHYVLLEVNNCSKLVNKNSSKE